MSRIYVITGSTSGIGKELVEVFSHNPEHIVFAGYRNEKKLPPKKKNNVIYFHIDMADSNSIVDAGKFIKTKTSHIDTLINVAGCVVAGPVEKLEIKKLQEQFQINTFSHIEFTQNLIDIINGGKIINISSMASFGVFPFVSPYCASKRALDIFFNALYWETHKNIKIISVKPGVIATPIWETSVEKNLELINSCEDYKKELEYVKCNALKNTHAGLPVSKIGKLIKKIDRCKNPKASYIIGKDALFAEILSLMPQGIINMIIKMEMKLRIK